MVFLLTASPYRGLVLVAALKN